MKKRLFATLMVAVLCVTSVLMLSGCGKDAALYDYDDLTEYIEVGEYKGLSYSKEKQTVTDEEVQQEIDNILQQSATTEEVKEGTVEDGDTINIAFVGKIDGKEFEGGSSESTDVTIGETQMIPGFIEGLVGKKIGEKVTLDLKFPEDYHSKEVAGKDVVFKVTINSEKVQNVPEFNDEFVKKNSDHKTTDEYKKAVEAAILQTKQDKADETMQAGLWEQIVADSKVKKYPEKELNNLISTTNESIKDSIKRQGMEWEDYLKQTGMTEEDFNKEMKKVAEERVHQDLVVYQIAKIEKLTVTDEEYEDFMDNMLKSGQFTKKTFKENFGMTIEQYCEERGIRTAMLFEKVINKVVDYGKLVEK